MILRAFSKAYDNLKTAMVAQSLSGAPQTSILGSIIGANYDEYTEQRFQLRQVYETSGQFDHYRSPPPPPPGNPPSLDGDRPPPPPRAPPPGPPSGPLPESNHTHGSGSNQTGRQRQETQQRRAQQAALPPRPPAPAQPAAPIAAPVAASQGIVTANAKAKPITIDLTEDKLQASLSAPSSSATEASESSLSLKGTFTPLSSESPLPQPEEKPTKTSRRKRGRANRPEYPAAVDAGSDDTSSSSSESESESESSASEASPRVRDNSTPPRVRTKRRATLRRHQACQERATRMKRLRPDLRVPKSLSLRQARLLTGYKTIAEMEEDLSRRESQSHGTTA